MEQLERQLLSLLSTNKNTTSCSQTRSQISCVTCKFHLSEKMHLYTKYEEMVKGLREALHLLQNIMPQINHQNYTVPLRNIQGGSKRKHSPIENETKALITPYGHSSTESSTPASFKNDTSDKLVTASAKTSPCVDETALQPAANDQAVRPVRQSLRVSSRVNSHMSSSMSSRRNSKLTIIVGGIRTHNASEVEEGGISSADEDEDEEKLFSSVTDFGTFKERLAELEEYIYKNGHCSVKSICHDNPSLGAWCTFMRSGYQEIKTGNSSPHGLDLVRIKQLERVGFQWKYQPPRTVFGDRVEELLAFKKKYGHCQVTQAFTGYRSLYKYVCRIRLGYKAFYSGRGRTHGLNAERIKRLDDIGFNWTSLKINDLRIEELIHFKKLKGHTRVPQDFPDNPVLGNWCHRMRLGFVAMKEEGSRHYGLERRKLFSRLDKIGFEWSINETADSRPEVMGNDSSLSDIPEGEIIVPEETTSTDIRANKFDQESGVSHHCTDAGKRIEEVSLLNNSSQQLGNNQYLQIYKSADIGRSEEKSEESLKIDIPIQEPTLLKDSSHQVGNEQRPQNFKSVDVEIVPVMPKRFQCGRVIIEFDSDDSDLD